MKKADAAEKAGDREGAKSARDAAKAGAAAAAEEARKAKKDLSRKKEEAEAAAKKRRDLSRKTEEAKKDIDALREQTGNGAAKDAAAAASAAASAMSAGAEQAESGRSGSAQASDGEAVEQLEQAASALEKAAGGRTKDPAKDAEALKDLAKKQEELAEKTKKLAESLKNVSPKGGEGAAKAQESMGEASQKMRRDEQEATEEAVDKQDEAIDYLDQAKENLEEQKNDYLGLQQEELLFKIGEEIEKLLKVQLEINKETVRLDRERAVEGRLGRTQRRDLKTIQDKQTASRDQLGTMLEALKKEDVLAFTWLLDTVKADMTRAAELMEQKETGPLLQSVEDDIVAGSRPTSDDPEGRKRSPQEDEEGRSEGAGSATAERAAGLDAAGSPASPPSSDHHEGGDRAILREGSDGDVVADFARDPRTSHPPPKQHPLAVRSLPREGEPAGRQRRFPRRARLAPGEGR
jgi:uncharacterized phage infection (PIP) family protein YhgE